MQFPEMLQALQMWSNEKQLEELAIGACKNALKTYIHEQKELGVVALQGHTLDELVLQIGRIALVYKHHILEYPFIETQVNISVDAPGIRVFQSIDRIGRYRVFTTLDGTLDDDDLEIDDRGEDVQLLPIVLEMHDFPNKEARNRFLERFTQEAIEENALQFGGGGQANVWRGLAEPRVPVTISQNQVHHVNCWIQRQPEIRRFSVGPVMPDYAVRKMQRQDPNFPTLEQERSDE